VINKYDEKVAIVNEKTIKKDEIIKKSELEGLFNLAGALENMLVDDYFYSFDLRMAGDYIISLRQRLEQKLTGTSLKELQKRDKEDRKES
jgi:hypothetical protein